MALVVCLAAALTARAAPQHATHGGALQGFVNARLLTSWCKSVQAVPVEACLSYLRGVFDTVQALRYEDGAPGAANGTRQMCVPATVPVTELRALLRRRVAHPRLDEATQAAQMVLGVLHARYPCPHGAGAKAAGTGR